jgi:hypothetical protein
VDSYQSNLGAYGGSNVGNQGNVQAGSTITLNGNAVINGSKIPNDPAGLTPVPVPSGAQNLGDLNINGNYNFSAGDYKIGTLNINGNPNVTTSGGLVRIWFNSINMAGTVGSASTPPGQLWFFSRSTATNCNINSNCTLYGVIFAPNVTVSDSATGGIFGAVVGSQVTLNGNASIHYDLRLGDGCSGGEQGHFAREPEGVSKAASADAGLPSGTILLMVPNPSKDIIWTFYRLGAISKVRLLIFDVAGDNVLDLDMGEQPVGLNRHQINVERLADGAYIAALLVDTGSGWHSMARFKMAVLRN